MNITKASARNIEDRINSARVIGLIKAFVDVLLFFNLHILTKEVGSNLHKKIRIYSYSHIISLPLFCLNPQLFDSTVNPYLDGLLFLCVRNCSSHSVSKNISFGKHCSFNIEYPLTRRVYFTNKIYDLLNL